MLDKATQYLGEMTGSLKDNTSIINPTILVDGSILTYPTLNYLFIPEFGNRRYFINNITSVRTNLFEISAHVDVLSTYASQIRQNRGIVKRQRDIWNLYLNDGSFRVYQNPLIQTLVYPSGFTDYQFILAVAGSP